jgi:plastocyanin
MKKFILVALAATILTLTATTQARAMTINIQQGAYIQDSGKGFDPMSADVKVNEPIRWHNADTVPHTATSGHPDDVASMGKLFDTGNIEPGMTSHSIHLNSAGLVHYFCQIHPFIVGKLTAN